MVQYPTIIPDYPNDQPPKEIHEALIRYLDPSGDTVLSIEPPNHPDEFDPELYDPDADQEEDD